MNRTILVIVGLLIVVFIAYCMALTAEGAPTTADRSGSTDKERNELHIAGAYACGMLDALQEKVKRAQACNDYRAIAKARGVVVPP